MECLDTPYCSNTSAHANVDVCLAGEAPDEAGHGLEGFASAVELDEGQQHAAAAGGSLEDTLPPLSQQIPDALQHAAVGVIALPPQPAEEVHQHTYDQSRNHPLQYERQHKAVHLLHDRLMCWSRVDAHMLALGR